MNAVDMNRYVGMWVTAVDHIDGLAIWTLRPMGRTTTRHIAIPDDAAISELRDGCDLLKRVAAAKHAVAQTNAAVS